MREIKFRAWDKLEEEMLDNEAIFGNELCVQTGHQDEDFIFMQYTGLHDKNGAEIYEGDIVIQDGYPWFDANTLNYVGVIEWVYSQWQVIYKSVNALKRGVSNGINIGLNDDGVNEDEQSDWEVIGNIYEHSYLLDNN